MKMLLFLSLFLSALACQGCSYDNWFAGFRQGRINECNKLPDSQREQCLQETSVSYEAYRAERDKATK